MDSCTSYGTQGVSQCDLCDKDLVYMCCDTCLISVCKACIEDHISSKPLISHNITDVSESMSDLLLPRCVKHSESPCKSFCRFCNIPVCLNCTVSGDIHRDHELSLMKDVLSSRKLVIHKDCKEFQKSITLFKNVESYLQIRMSQLEKEYGYISKAIERHGKKWQREIDKLVRRMTAEVDEMRVSHLEALTKHHEEIRQRVLELQYTIQMCEQALASCDTSVVLNYTSLNEKYRNLPQKLCESYPAFAPQSIPKELRELFGTLTKLSIIPDKHGYRMKTHELENGSCPQVRNLLDEPKIVGTISTGHKELHSVTCLSEEEIWTKGTDSTMKLFSISQDSQLKSFTSPSGNTPEDIAMTLDRNLVYTDYDDKTVNIVKNGEIEEVIRLQNWIPKGLCSTCSGDLLVVMDNDDNKETKVVRYSGSTEKQTIQFDDEGNALFSTGFYMYLCENRNLDICVADGSGAVVVVNQAGHLRFRYTGHTPTPKNYPFYPVGIATDSQGHILISDFDNQCVHITDQDGQFLRYIECGQIRPWGLCVDTSDNLFVVDFTKKSGKIIKYEYLN